MKTKEKEKLEKKLTKEIDRLKNSTELLLTDATMIQKYCASIITFSSAQKNLADIDKSGAIDIADATYIQKKISGLIADDSDKKDDVIELPIIPVVRWR